MLITPQTEAARLVLGHLDTLIPILSCLNDIEGIARASAVSRSWNIATQRLHLKVLSRLLRRTILRFFQTQNPQNFWDWAYPSTSRWV